MGLKKYFNFLDWETRISILKPLPYYKGAQELKPPKQKKGKLLALRPGEYVVVRGQKEQLVVLAVEKKFSIVEVRGDPLQSRYTYARHRLQSQEYIEQKSRGDLQISVHYDPIGFGELSIWCHGVSNVSAAKSKGCQFLVKAEKWTPKNAIGKPLKTSKLTSPQAVALPEEHVFQLCGLKDIKVKCPTVASNPALKCTTTTQPYVS